MTKRTRTIGASTCRGGGTGFDGLTSEQKEKALGCKTPEELLALADAEGYVLSDEELEAISGGSWGSDIDLPACTVNLVKSEKDAFIRRRLV